MLFRRSFEQERGVFVDRGIDGRVDEFQICEPCDAIVGIKDEKGERWHDFNRLCDECRVGFVIESTISDLMGKSRPINGMLEGRVVTNDEMNADPPGPDPSFMRYFYPNPYEGPSTE